VSTSVNRRELTISLAWLVPMIGAGLLSVLVSPGGLLWALAVAAAVLSGANVALHLDLVAH
jgi:fatty acid desaturase